MTRLVVRGLVVGVAGAVAFACVWRAVALEMADALRSIGRPEPVEDDVRSVLMDQWNSDWPHVIRVSTN